MSAAPTDPSPPADLAALARGGRINFFGFCIRLAARLPFLFIAGRVYGAEALGRFAYAVLIVEFAAQRGVFDPALQWMAAEVGVLRGVVAAAFGVFQRGAHARQAGIVDRANGGRRWQLWHRCARDQRCRLRQRAHAGRGQE